MGTDFSPFRSAFDRRMDELFESFFPSSMMSGGGDWSGASSDPSSWHISPFNNRALRCDVKETTTAYEILCDVPGYNKSEVTVTNHGNVLNIKAKHTEGREFGSPMISGGPGGSTTTTGLGGRGGRAEEKTGMGGGGTNGNWLCMERCLHSLHRTIKLPHNANFEAPVSARVDNGLLFIVVPKKPEGPGSTSPGERNITIS